MQFNLVKTAAKLNSFNIRSENHGETKVPAGDIKLTIKTTNETLNVFSPNLKQALYFNQKAEQGQADVEGVDPILPNLKFANLETPLKLKDEGIGYKMIIDWGLGEEGGSNMLLEGCKVSKFTATCEEGGTVELSFRVQITDPSAEVIGRLGRNVQREITIDLMPPVAMEPANVTPIKRGKKMTRDQVAAAEQELFLNAQDKKEAEASGKPDGKGPWPFPTGAANEETPLEPGSPAAALAASMH